MAKNMTYICHEGYVRILRPKDETCAKPVWMASAKIEYIPLSLC